MLVEAWLTDTPYKAIWPYVLRIKFSIVLLSNFTFRNLSQRNKYRCRQRSIYRWLQFGHSFQYKLL